MEKIPFESTPAWWQVWISTSWNLAPIENEEKLWMPLHHPAHV
jgi:hypothetical protein